MPPWECIKCLLLFLIERLIKTQYENQTRNLPLKWLPTRGQREVFSAILCYHGVVEWVLHWAVTVGCIKAKLFQWASSYEGVWGSSSKSPRSLNFYMALYGKGWPLSSSGSLTAGEREPLSPIPFGEDDTSYSGRNYCKYPGSSKLQAVTLPFE
jgi:hypothetical protein